MSIYLYILISGLGKYNMQYPRVANIVRGNKRVANICLK